MKKWFILWLLISVPGWMNAQNREIVEAATGDNLTDKVSTHMQYLFPEFTDGAVYYIGQPKSGGKLNYNMLLGEMQFIDANNNIMALANVNDIAMVTIGNRKFYPFNGKEFVEEIIATPKMQLQLRRKGNSVSHSKKGAYGSSSSTSSITSYSSIRSSSSGSTHDLAVIENVLISLNKLYYLVPVSNKRILIKNQKTFAKQFPQHKAQIETFVNEHNIRFNSEDDLKVLIEYCSSL